MTLELEPWQQSIIDTNRVYQEEAERLMLGVSERIKELELKLSDSELKLSDSELEELGVLRYQKDVGDGLNHATISF